MNPQLDAARARFIAGIAEVTGAEPAILRAFESVDRADFVPSYFMPDPGAARSWPIRWQSFSSADGAPWIDHVYSPRAALVTRLGPDSLPASSSTDPSLMVQMLRALRTAPGERVLEIGAGTGYNAAVLSHLVGAAGRVFSLEVDEEICGEAAARLRAYPNVNVACADGLRGYPPAAPYDAILVTANAARVESSWLSQLAPGGRLVANLSGPMASGLFAGRALDDGMIEGRFLDIPEVGFTPLYGQPPDPEPDYAVVGSEDEVPPQEVPAAVAEALLEDADALAFIQLTVFASRAVYEIVGRGVHRRGVAFRRGDEHCWISAPDPPAAVASGFRASDTPLLEELISAHGRWVAQGRPRRPDLTLRIGPAGTRASIAGRLVCATRLFSPIVDTPLPGR